VQGEGAGPISGPFARFGSGCNPWRNRRALRGPHMSKRGLGRGFRTCDRGVTFHFVNPASLDFLAAAFGLSVRHPRIVGVIGCANQSNAGQAYCRRGAGVGGGGVGGTGGGVWWGGGGAYGGEPGL